MNNLRSYVGKEILVRFYFIIYILLQEFWHCAYTYRYIRNSVVLAYVCSADRNHLSPSLRRAKSRNVRISNSRELVKRRENLDTTTIIDIACWSCHFWMDTRDLSIFFGYMHIFCRFWCLLLFSDVYFFGNFLVISH